MKPEGRNGMERNESKIIFFPNFILIKHDETELDRTGRNRMGGNHRDETGQD